MPGLLPRAPPTIRTHTCRTTGHFLKIFIYLFLGVLGLWCFARAFFCFGEPGLPFISMHSFLIVWFLLLWSTGPRARAQ